MLIFCGICLFLLLSTFSAIWELMLFFCQLNVCFLLLFESQFSCKFIAIKWQIHSYHIALHWYSSWFHFLLNMFKVLWALWMYEYDQVSSNCRDIVTYWCSNFNNLKVIRLFKLHKISWKYQEFIQETLEKFTCQLDALYDNW